MASLVRHAISCASPSASSTCSSRSSNKSSRSFSSWRTKRPRDSLEKMRERKNSKATLLPQPRYASIQDRDDDEEVESLPLVIPRPPINRNIVCERYPKGKASLLVFMLNVLVMYAYGAAITGVLNIFQTERYEIDGYVRQSPLTKQSLHFIKLLFQYCISRMFYPFTGFIADVYIGRWRMIYLSILLLLIGYVIIVVSITVEGESDVHLSWPWKNGINGIAFLLLSIGGGAFEATLIPLGIDQLQGASSSEISSYFFFFYSSRNIGMAGGIVISCLMSYMTIKITDIEEGKRLEMYDSFQPLVTAAILTLGLILMICLHHWFFKNTLWENPVKLIAKILCYAATVKRHLPVRNRAFRYGEERKKRIELAKITYDGKFPDEKVEDVKIFCRIFLILLSLLPTMFSLNALNILLSQEISETLTGLYSSKYLKVDLYPNVYWGVNNILVILILPVVNFIVIPCFPKLTIRARMGIGLALYCTGSLAVVATHAVPFLQNRDKVSGHELSWLAIPMLIFALAEVLTTVSVLEFIYAQSPESMKGLLTGLYFFFLGLTSIPASALYYVYKTNLSNKPLLLFYSIFTIFMVVGTIFYLAAAARHKNRQRYADDDSLQQRLIIENQLHSTVTA